MFFPVGFVLNICAVVIHGCHSPQLVPRFTHVPESALLQLPWASLPERKFTRGRLAGLSVAPVMAACLGALRDSHHLHPLLSIFDSPHPQPAALKVSVTYLWCDPSPHSEWPRAVSASGHHTLHRPFLVIIG